MEQIEEKTTLGVRGYALPKIFEILHGVMVF